MQNMVLVIGCWGYLIEFYRQQRYISSNILECDRDLPALFHFVDGVDWCVGTEGLEKAKSSKNTWVTIIQNFGRQFRWNLRLPITESSSSKLGCPFVPRYHFAGIIQRMRRVVAFWLPCFLGLDKRLVLLLSFHRFPLIPVTHQPTDDSTNALNVPAVVDGLARHMTGPSGLL